MSTETKSDKPTQSPAYVSMTDSRWESNLVEGAPAVSDPATAAVFRVVSLVTAGLVGVAVFAAARSVALCIDLMLGDAIPRLSHVGNAEGIGDTPLWGDVGSLATFAIDLASAAAVLAACSRPWRRALKQPWQQVTVVPDGAFNCVRVAGTDRVLTADGPLPQSGVVYIAGLDLTRAVLRSNVDRRLKLVGVSRSEAVREEHFAS